MVMNWLDIAIVSIILLSAIISFFRGFIKEFLSLVIWIGAVCLGAYYAETVGSLFTMISIKVVRTGVGGFLVALMVLLGGGLINFALSNYVKLTGLGLFDRLVGLFFGFVRGGLVVCVLVLMIMTSSIVDQSWWQESSLVPKFQSLTNVMTESIPAEWKQAVIDRLDGFTF